MASGAVLLNQRSWQLSSNNYCEPCLCSYVVYGPSHVHPGCVCVCVFIGRAKRAPHWGVQSRFRVIYIYIYIYICVSVVCQITWNHVNQIRACSKSVLGGKIRPVTPVLFISAIR